MNGAAVTDVVVVIVVVVIYVGGVIKFHTVQISPSSSSA
jgi:hypothetical protein